MIELANDGPGRRYIVLAEGMLTDYHAKTAHGVLRYGRERVVAVVDSTFAGKRVVDVIPSIVNEAPIVATLDEALAFTPTAVLIGVATEGGTLPVGLRGDVIKAVDAKLEIVNGLHELLGDDDEIVAHARRSGAKLWDVRVPPQVGVFTGAAYDVPQIVALAVGTDCAVGKMTAMLEIERAARRDNVDARFVATGQTGIVIAGAGIAVDHVLSDYVAGAGERLVTEVNPETAYTLVEGQGSIVHPAYAPVTFGLLLGCAPDLLILCHELGRETIGGFAQRIAPLADVLRAHEEYLRFVKPAPFAAIVLNTASVDERTARLRIAALEDELQLTVDDPVRFGADRLWAALRDAAPSTAKALRSARATSGARR